MSKKRILVVDDELDMRTFLTTLVETSGHRPVPAGDGLEGLRRAREKRPDLIIMDVMMPQEGGIEMYRELKTDPDLKTIPVIMLSGIAKKTFFHAQSMLDRHLDQSVPEPEVYIEKPPEAEEILDWIQKLLRD
jgi:CheY-like chemotaxis protein